jgi:nitrogen regulatory protein PII
MRFNMLFTICPNDKVQVIIDSAKSAGATGATILSVRGTGHKEAKTFFGLTLDRPQEALVMLVEKHKETEIMDAIYRAGEMKKPGNGICFSLKIENVVGLESQLGILKKEAEEFI